MEPGTQCRSGTAFRFRVWQTGRSDGPQYAFFWMRSMGAPSIRLYGAGTMTGPGLAASGCGVQGRIVGIALCATTIEGVAVRIVQ